jgi:hypothetical protein
MENNQTEKIYTKEDMILFSEWVSRHYPNQTHYIRNRDSRRDIKGYYTTEELLEKFMNSK